MTAGDVYRALWRHKLFIAVMTAAFVAATLSATSRQSVKYETSTLVRVQERGPSAGNASAALQASQDLAQTYAKIVDSGALEDEIDALIPAGAAGRKARGVKLSAEPVQDLDLISITARGSSPAGAAMVADVAPRALRAFIRRTGSSSESIVVVKPASAGSPVSRHLALNGVIALMLGLIFNGALALLIEVFRDRLPDPEDLGQAVGHPLLATIPPLRFRRDASTAPDSLLTMEQSFDGETRPRVTGPRAGPEP